MKYINTIFNYCFSGGATMFLSQPQQHPNHQEMQTIVAQMNDNVSVAAVVLISGLAVTILAGCLIQLRELYSTHQAVHGSQMMNEAANGVVVQDIVELDQRVRRQMEPVIDLVPQLWDYIDNPAVFENENPADVQTLARSLTELRQISEEVFDMCTRIIDLDSVTNYETSQHYLRYEETLDVFTEDLYHIIRLLADNIIV